MTATQGECGHDHDGRSCAEAGHGGHVSNILAQGIGRRAFLTVAAGSTFLASSGRLLAATAETVSTVNLAKVARVQASYVSGDTKVGAVNSGVTPASSFDTARGMFGTWPRHDPQWLEYSWDKPVTTNRAEIFWWVDGGGIGLPGKARIEAWDGKRFVPLEVEARLGLLADRFNEVRFRPVTTTRLRLAFESDGKVSVGVLQWRVMSVGPVPAFAPVVVAGVDRAVVLGGKTYLAGSAEWLDRKPGDTTRWHKASGPGPVKFADPTAAQTNATFSVPGDYVLELRANGAGESAVSTVAVRAETPPPAHRLDVVYTTPYSIDSPLWNARAKSLIVNWIPHCIAYCERTDLKEGQGGLDNFIEAGKALRREKHAPHKGYVFANAWVHQTVESMCIALMVDGQGDAEIAAAQAHMRTTLERWIPIILGAQEADGYLQTAYTLANRTDWRERWSAEHRADHEGYVAGYFIESAINHHTLTGGKDLRLYDAAKKLADCWVANIGPGKKPWFDGHQEMEQALVRFGRFVNDVEGGNRGTPYITLARFLLDSREGGAEYDQSHLPAVQQYTAVGHAVRAVYFYSGMADVAAETNDPDYQSAVLSLWDNMVNRKYYVTGGVGSGETSEGFGPDYSLPENAYCESCSSCGLIFFQYKMNLAYHDAKYADLYEETMYNALLGSTDLAGRNFCYTNPLVDTERTAWHVCPCCVGNIPRTLLMMPTWTYAKDAKGLNVNLFVGSTMDVGDVAGVPVRMIQKTSYPWAGEVELQVQPQKPATFALRIRVPNRATSILYTATPAVSGMQQLTVNGKPVPVVLDKGYAVITREWRTGDKVAFVLPLAVQRVKASEKIAAAQGKVALRYGPLVYNVETADQARLDGALGAGPLTTRWEPELLGGVVTIRGKWADGTPMRAVPNFARMNRGLGGGAEFGATAGVDYAPGSEKAKAAETAAAVRKADRGHSRVWLIDGKDA